MKTQRGLAALALTATLALSASACGSSSDDSSSGSGPDLISDGTLTVCSDVPYAPFEDFDKGSSVGFKGFDVDIDKVLAKDLGVKLKIKDSDFNAIQSGLSLNSGACDLASSAITITSERAKKIGFSTGYYDSQQSLLVPSGSSIASIADLAGKKVGVQKGTTGETYTEENAPKADRIQYPSDGEMYQALKAGNVDALLQDLPVNLAHQNDSAQAGKFKVVATFKTDEEYGLAMKKTNTKLIKAVDASLKKAKSDGTYQKIYDTYFSTD